MFHLKPQKDVVVRRRIAMAYQSGCGWKNLRERFPWLSQRVLDQALAENGVPKRERGERGIPGHDI